MREMAGKIRVNFPNFYPTFTPNYKLFHIYPLQSYYYSRLIQNHIKNKKYYNISKKLL